MTGQESRSTPAEEQVGALRQALAAQQWWCIDIHPGGIQSMDACVREILAPLAAELQADGAQRWFYLRYHDLDGPHLRFRAQGPGRSVTSWHRRIPELRRAVADLVAGSAVQWIAPVNSHLTRGRSRGVTPRIYEPEWAKYGGAQGVALAERAFQSSSELCLQAVRLDKVPIRCAFAVAVMQSSTGLLRPDLRSAFWQRHQQFWSGGEHSAAQRFVPAPEKFQRWVAVCTQVRAGHPEWDEAIGRWITAVGRYLTDAIRAGVPLTSRHLLFHQLHMTLNRLGILPAEEAVLGQVTALLAQQAAPTGRQPNRSAWNQPASRSRIGRPHALEEEIA